MHTSGDGRQQSSMQSSFTGSITSLSLARRSCESVGYAKMWIVFYSFIMKLPSGCGYADLLLAFGVVKLADGDWVSP